MPFIIWVIVLSDTSHHHVHANLSHLSSSQLSYSPMLLTISILEPSIFRNVSHYTLSLSSWSLYISMFLIILIILLSDAFHYLNRINHCTLWSFSSSWSLYSDVFHHLNHHTFIMILIILLYSQMSFIISVISVILLSVLFYLLDLLCFIYFLVLLSSWS